MPNFISKTDFTLSNLRLRASAQCFAIIWIKISVFIAKQLYNILLLFFDATLVTLQRNREETETTEDIQMLDEVEQFSQDKAFDVKSDYYMECKYSLTLQSQLT